MDPTIAALARLLVRPPGGGDTDFKPRYELGGTQPIPDYGPTTPYKQAVADADIKAYFAQRAARSPQRRWLNDSAISDYMTSRRIPAETRWLTSANAVPNASGGINWYDVGSRFIGTSANEDTPVDFTYPRYLNQQRVY